MEKLRGAGTPVLLLCVLGWLAWNHFHPPVAVVKPDQVIDASVLGKEFAPVLAADLADGFDAGADLLEKKDTVKNAHAAMTQTFFDERQASFKTKVSPVFAAVVPDGAEPKDDATRAEYAKLWRSFAKGLRGVR